MTRGHDDSGDLASGVGATATMVAAGRALASKGPGALIDDPFAEPLVEAVGLDFFTKQVKGELDVSGLDAQALAFVRLMVDGVAVRTKYFDDYFLAAAATGTRQAVILASGLDARAYRLPWPAGTVVYEIDQPKVIAFKDAALARIGAAPTAECRPVAVDLRDDWPAALRAAGLDTAAATAWSAEGLLMYLPPDAQERLLDAVTALSAVGSTIAADYDTEVGDGEPGGAAISQTWRERGFELDMPALRAGGERHDVAEYLTGRGWRMTSSPVDEMFTRYGIPRTRIDARDPFDTTVYATGTRTG